MIVGQPLTLECVATAVRGINSQVDIIWNNNSSAKEFRRNDVNASMTNLLMSSVVYKDYFNISQLTTDDNNVTYQCEIIINSNPSVMASGSFTLHVIGKNLRNMYMIMIIILYAYSFCMCSFRFCCYYFTK